MRYPSVLLQTEIVDSGLAQWVRELVAKPEDHSGALE